jgi:hypothetical protein
MRASARTLVILSGGVVTLLILAGSGGDLIAKERSSPTNPNDPTVRLYSLLDSKYSGKLDDFYMLADLVNDPKNPGQQLQRVIRIEYNKVRGFGKLNLHVRTVAALTPDQLKAYTPKQIYDFAEADAVKFTKTDPGSFGRPGDVYFEAASDGGALTSTTVTAVVQAQYDAYITQYLLPALEKKDASGS